MGRLARVTDPTDPVRQYGVAVLAAGAAVLARAALDPVLQGDHALVIPLLAVVFVAWRHGFGPAVLTLFVSVAPVVYLFIEPRDSFAIDAWNDRIALALFSAAGVCCALLGEAQHRANRRTRLREGELRESEERYRFLAETLPALVWSSRADGTPDYHNTRWYEYTGLPRHDGRDPVAEVVHPDDRTRTVERWRRALETGTRYQHEFRLRRADGVYRWFLAQALPMRGPGGAVARWFGTAVDIDDQKRLAEVLEQRVAERTAQLLQQVEERRKAEEQVQAVAAELARSNEELEKFAYVASHDLQEPLRKIQAFGDRLRVRYRDGLGEQGQDYMDRILKAAGRMRRLIEDLLALSRVTTKGQPFAPVDLSAVAEGVVSDLEERVAETGAAVDVGPLPTVDADATQMRQLVQNLLGNALKFHRPGVPPAVTVRAEPVPDSGDGPPTCRITVTDNGIGFDEKYLDRIFEVFQRLHGRGEYEGTGIGLAICRKIVERHGGTITARSTPGAGTTFVVTLPLRHPDGQT